jgi:hypothetical protein
MCARTIILLVCGVTSLPIQKVTSPILIGVLSGLVEAVFVTQRYVAMFRRASPIGLAFNVNVVGILNMVDRCYRIGACPISFVADVGFLLLYHVDESKAMIDQTPTNKSEPVGKDAVWTKRSTRVNDTAF